LTPDVSLIVTKYLCAHNPRYRYQTFTEADYQVFLADFAIRIGGGCVYQPGAKPDDACGNFRKPGMQV
jgi:hypothetical protein